MVLGRFSFCSQNPLDLKIDSGLPTPACPRFDVLQWRGPGMREQKITLGEMRASGPTRLLVYCGDYKCAHSLPIDARRWSDNVRLSDLEPKFICQVCGHRGADVRPMFEPARIGTVA
jgi:hypothetical protein